jgi:transcriptional regulator with XRE-family HTH domain
MSEIVKPRITKGGDTMESAEGVEPPASTRILRVGIDRATMRGRWLGTRLREHRRAAGMKGAEVGKRVGRTPGTISKWESGDVIPGPSEIFYMLDIYGVGEDERKRLMRHAEEARQPGLSEVDEADAVDDHAWLESMTWRIETFRSHAVHGLLQTRDYVRELLMGAFPTVRPERLAGVIAAREMRQLRLHGENPLQLSVILDEAVLRRMIGGPEVMRSQLEVVVERAALPNVEIRVVPFAAGAHAGLAGGFDLMRFRDEDDIVFVETRDGSIYLPNSGAYTDALRLLATVALPAAESLAMIEAIAGEIA